MRDGLSSVIKLHGRWAVNLHLQGSAWLFFFITPGRNHSSDPSIFCLCLLSGCRHVMNELLETERAYVEELLCVLQVPILPLCVHCLLSHVSDFCPELTFDPTVSTGLRL